MLAAAGGDLASAPCDGRPAVGDRPGSYDMHDERHVGDNRGEVEMSDPDLVVQAHAHKALSADVVDDETATDAAAEVGLAGGGGARVCTAA